MAQHQHGRIQSRDSHGRDSRRRRGARRRAARTADRVGHTGPLRPSETGRPIPYVDPLRACVPRFWHVVARAARRFVASSTTSSWGQANMRVRLVTEGGSWVRTRRSSGPTTGGNWRRSGCHATMRRRASGTRCGSNQLLARTPPPVRTARLLGHDRRRLSLTFEALLGVPLGPKYPEHLGDDGIDAALTLGEELAAFRPRARWMRRLHSSRRLDLAHRYGLLTDAELVGLRRIGARAHTRRQFGHGDLTPRNVLVLNGGGVALIDWEWAGLYPPGYDLAFLWFSLVDVPGGRDRVEARVHPTGSGFLLSALLIQLWHLQWYVSPSFRQRHLQTRDELIDRLLG